MRKHRARWLLFVIPLLALAAAVAAPAYVVAATRPYRYADPTQVPPRRVAIVFGAGVVGGRPTPALAERIRGAVELYRLGRVHKLLMTGDNSRLDYNEAGAMRDYAVSLGVPEADITLDYAGFSTYESAYRALAIFGVREAVLVTQGYHLPRAVYTCRALGIDAVGYGMPDWLFNRERMAIRYSRYDQVRYTLREVLAICKALVDVHITRPLPTFLGAFEGIN